MNKLARVSIAVAVVVVTAGLTVLMALFTWVALTVCALAFVGLGWAVYDFLSLRGTDKTDGNEEN